MQVSSCYWLQQTECKPFREVRFYADNTSLICLFRGHPDMLVLVDETGTDRRDCMRQFEYSLRGRPAVTQELHVRGQLLLKCVVTACWTYVQCWC